MPGRRTDKGSARRPILDVPTVTYPYICKHCNKQVNSAIARGRHISRCPGPSAASKLAAGAKKRKANNGAGTELDPVRLREQAANEMKQPQDQATEYSSTCLWTRPNRSAHLALLRNRDAHEGQRTGDDDATERADHAGGASDGAATTSNGASTPDHDGAMNDAADLVEECTDASAPNHEGKNDAANPVEECTDSRDENDSFGCDDDSGVWEDFSDDDESVEYDGELEERLNSDLEHPSDDSPDHDVEDLLRKWTEIARTEREREREWSGRNQKWAHFRKGQGRGTKWKEPFRYCQGSLPMHYVAQISLLKILSEHRDNDLGIFDRIMDWVLHFTRKDASVWKRAGRHRKTRKSLILFLAKFFDMRGAFPTPTDVMCSRGKVTVPVYDFEQQLLSIIGDPELMSDENLIQNNFDKETLRPIKSYDELLDNDIVDDVNDGRLYSAGSYEFCDDNLKPPDCDMIVPTPLIIYCDEAATDNYGKLSLEPIEFACAWNKREARAKFDANRLLGYVPNLDVVSGKNADNYDDEWTKSKNTKDRTKKTKTTKTVGKGDESAGRRKLKDRHACYRAVFKSMMDVIDAGGVRAKYRGKRCLFKPFVLAVIGDTKGYNILCCKFNCTGNRNVNSLMKCCLCSFGDLTKTRPKCRRVTAAEVEKAHKEANEEYCKEISFHPIESAWSELPIADIVEGITGVTPYEALHVHGHGTYKDAIEFIHDFLGAGDTNKAAKEEFDLLFKQVAADLMQNAEKRFPLISTAHGIMDLTKVTGMERKGNYLVMVVCLQTDRGREIISRCIAMKRGRKDRKEANGKLNLAAAKEDEASKTKDKNRAQSLRKDAEALRAEAQDIMNKTAPTATTRRRKKGDSGAQTDPYRDLLQFQTKMVIETMCLVLAYDEWCARPKKKWELENAEEAVTHLLRFIKRYLPKYVVVKKDGSTKKGANGYHKVKFHALWTFIHYQKKFGCSANTDGGAGEQHHKWSVNRSGQQTQRRWISFADQTARRTTEHTLIAHAHKFVRHMCPPDRRNLYNYTTKDKERLLTGKVTGNEKLLGRVELYLRPEPKPRKAKQHTFNFSHMWLDNRRRIAGMKPSSLLLQGIATDCQSPMSQYVTNTNLREVVVEAWTELRVPGAEPGSGSVIYRCCEDYDGFGRPRYDWALVLSPPGLDRRGKTVEPSTWIARLLGFFRYKTPGYPTWQLRDVDGFSEEEILDEQMTDDTLYVACIGANSQTGYVTKEQLDAEIIYPFVLDEKPDVYLLPATAIQMPLAVVRNFGSSNRRSFIQVSQQQHWKNKFTSLVKSKMDSCSDDEASVESVQVNEEDFDSEDDEFV